MKLKRKIKGIIPAFALCVVIMLLLCGCVFGNFSSNDISGQTSTGATEREDENGYYFDSNAESGGNGSMASPYNSLDKVGEIAIQAGDTLYFKAGSVFYGSLQLENISGTAENPVTVTGYGNGALPVLDGNGLTGEQTGVICIKNCSGLIVEGMDICDSVQSSGDRRGVLVTAEGRDGNAATYSDITLKALYIHDIKGIVDSNLTGMSAESKRTGGIQVWTPDGLGRFDGLTVTECLIENVSNVGVATWYKPTTAGSGKKSPYDEDFENYAYTNVEISHNEISNVGKNGIFARNLKGGVIEYNVIHDTNAVCYGGNSICTSYVDGTVIQYNEGYSNRARANASAGGIVQDGCMLDADLQSKDTLWQYNYSHDNAFGLFENCTDSRDKVTVRYNLSVNDRGSGGGIVYMNYAAAEVDIYNNTFITSPENAPLLLQTNENNMQNFLFRNNIIYNRSESATLKVNYTHGAFSHNLVYGFTDDDFSLHNVDGIDSDPLFLTTAGETLEERIGWNKTEVCRLNASSPALTAGIRVEGAEQDILGNPYFPSVGCYCGK